MARSYFPNLSDGNTKPSGDLEFILRESDAPGKIDHIDIGQEQILYDQLWFNIHQEDYLADLSNGYQLMVTAMNLKLGEFRSYSRNLDEVFSKKRLADYIPRFIKKMFDWFSSESYEVNNAIDREENNIRTYGMMASYFEEGARFLSNLGDTHREEIAGKIAECQQYNTQLISKTKEIVSLAEKAKQHYKTLLL